MSLFSSFYDISVDSLKIYAFLSLVFFYIHHTAALAVMKLYHLYHTTL